MIRKALSIAVSLSLVLPPVAVAQDTPPPEARSVRMLPLVYTGGNGRIGIGIDQDGDVQGEALGVFGFDGRRAFLAEGWLGDGGAGGAKFGYHWLDGERGANASVVKLLLAADQNRFSDRKATVGVGVERRGGEFTLTYSRELSGQRLVGSDLDSSSETITGTLDGRPYQQVVTTDTLTETFAHPYEQGIGVRLGRFYERGLVRLRGGLDYERGDAMLEGERASQFSATLGVEKYFIGSGHSLAFDLAQARRRGPFETDRDDTRATVRWRYEFGKPFRGVGTAVPALAAAAPVSAPAARPSLVRNEVELSGEALFAFNRAVLTEAAKADLWFLVEMLKTSLVGTVEIVGHTCDLGSEAYNQALSEARAAAVYRWLVSEGVPADALLVSGEGELSPQVPNDSEANRARNRRVELRFTTAEESAEPAPPPVPAPSPAVAVAPADDAWIDRALRNLPAHKRTVDTYRVVRVTETVTLGPIEYLNQAPVADDDSVATFTNTPVEFDVLANDTDPDGDALSVAVNYSTGHGTLTQLQPNGGTFRYTPDQDFEGIDFLIYTVSDGNGGFDTATVTVTVQPTQNQAPVAADDAATTTVGTAVDVAVLANDSDPDGDTLSIADVGQPANGTAIIVGNGVRYVPNPGYTGTDTFLYTVSDGNGGTATGTVTVTVQPAQNQAPVAADDAATTPFDTAVDIAVLANDSDPDGDALTIAGVGQPANGTATIAGSEVRYVPNPGYSGTDAFTYTVSDGNGGTATGTVTVTVEPAQNQPPVANDDMVSTPDGTTIDIDVLANDEDPDGDALTIVGVTQPDRGTATIVGDRVRYVPEMDFIGTVTFTYTVADGNGGTDTATVTVVIEQPPPNQAPVAMDDFVLANDNTPVEFDVLANDTDPDGHALYVVDTTSTTHGTLVQLQPNGGVFMYTPDQDYIGTDTFTYTVSDGNGGVDTATVTIEVIVP
jgi:outer membrane protein OmpA-like peptidoglycan-associated protein